MSLALANVGYQSVALLPATVITTAVTNLTGPVVTGLLGMQVLTCQAALTYGSGGTNVTAYVQTTFDGGVTWVDIVCFQFTTATARAINSVRSAAIVTANYTPTDGSLAANTIKDGLLGDQLRVKYTSTGTYAGNTTLSVTAVAKGA